ncbi:hypothetical protein SeMB42_g03496 [Synchytrium endobioticum]|uniref:Uncharacterized protein n=1 Tax=Synchytrium endobioticum TaxID=286115 RepID=A0A507D6R5_9FUNG|nr:hypothetical protein SeMB42_g03498 [Synchytrium endobioticum]TPX47007.1 hypothetical protein SeMB42_g03496 [Synchytrium endobioticum]
MTVPPFTHMHIHWDIHTRYILGLPSHKGCFPPSNNDQVPPSSKISRPPVIACPISISISVLFIVIILSVRPPYHVYNLD